MSGKIIAFTGSHGTGKSTATFQKAAELKLDPMNVEKDVSLITENAKHAPGGINKKATIESQLWIFSNQLQREVTLCSQYDLVISDRTVVDAIAYTKVNSIYSKAYSWEEPVKAMISMAKIHFPAYKEIYFRLIRNNDYLFNNGVRDANDRQYRQDVEDALIEIYKEILFEKSLNDCVKFI